MCKGSSNISMKYLCSVQSQAMFNINPLSEMCAVIHADTSYCKWQNVAPYSSPAIVAEGIPKDNPQDPEQKDKRTVDATSCHSFGIDTILGGSDVVTLGIVDLGLFSKQDGKHSKQRVDEKRAESYGPVIAWASPRVRLFGHNRQNV